MSCQLLSRRAGAVGKGGRGVTVGVTVGASVGVDVGVEVGEDVTVNVALGAAGEGVGLAGGPSA